MRIEEHNGRRYVMLTKIVRVPVEALCVDTSGGERRKPSSDGSGRVGSVRTIRGSAGGPELRRLENRIMRCV